MGYLFEKKNFSTKFIEFFYGLPIVTRFELDHDLQGHSGQLSQFFQIEPFNPDPGNGNNGKFYIKIYF